MLARGGGDERFFGFIDILYKSQDRWARARDPMAELAKIARLGGMSQQQFDACMADQAVMDTVLAKRMAADNTFQIRSTPSFVINGEVVAGGRDFADFQKLLDPLLPEG